MDQNGKKAFMKDRGLLFSFLLPIVFVVIGVLLLFTPITSQIFAIMIGAIMIIVGAAYVIRYFVEKAYLDMRSYGFSIGIFAIILGIVAVINSAKIENSLTVFLAVCIMLAAVIHLQNAITLKFLKSVFWIPVLCAACIFIVCTLLITLVPFDPPALKTFTAITLTASGVIGFAIAVGMRNLRKKHESTALVNNG